ncbi:serine hydrolase [Pseudoalteromonas denitrificans]|uniref:CubicO group peptidase, beta-lactamase class C family n=1 Tax=Pseudoalteromonas denitrificans DSM 6059 TaxID=1123010 RepID=A0A1I1QDA8_9GAMM|nr:serine hydrolase [Pseudoalteromonas denitrificans]SFD20086.1 CubicO group peptidase, beta-lactamase class C family [Pseudoalteromonas denitrificans DSM 6059]
MQIKSSYFKKAFSMSLLTSALFLAGCGSNDSDKKIDENPLLKFKGVWQLPGYGEVLDFKDNSLITYNTNSYGCVKVSEVQFDKLPLYSKYLSLDNNKLIYDNPFTSTATFQKQDTNFDACNVDKLLKSDDPITNFEFLWHTFNDYYAFFELRELNWQAVYEQYRPLVTASTTQEQLGDIFEAMLDDIDDGHISLSNKDTYIANGGDIKGRALQAYKLALSLGDEAQFGALYQAINSINLEVIKSNLVDGNLKQYDNSNAIHWGELPGNIGYLSINRVMGMNKTNADAPLGANDQLAYVEQDLKDTDLIMQTVMTQFKDTQGLVIDLRINNGGLDKVSQKIASYFSQTEYTFATKHVANKAFNGDKLSLKVVASPIEAYIKPIYVLTGQSSGSGGEVLTQALKSLAHVTTIGQATEGSVSDSLEFVMPNGWALSLSNEIYTDLQGAILEGQGVKPDVEMPVYAMLDLQMGSDTPIDYVLQQFGITPANVMSFDKVEQQIKASFDTLKLPGMSLAVIKNNEIVWETGFGFADIETERPITEHTPFNVGSVSKTMLATAIAQQVELGNVSLELPINEMNLPFEINNPHSDEPIKLKHLVSHTSGLLDTQNYNCSYYIHETGESLYASFGVEACDIQATLDTATFYQEYFTQGEKYYTDDVFATDDDALPGSYYEYSNVGAGLAGFAIEKLLDIDLSQTMKSQLFEPMGMLNTAWDHTQLSEQNPKAVQYSLDESNDLIAMPEFSYPTFFDGDLNTSAHDLARLLITIGNKGMIDNKRILKAQTVEMMLTPPVDTFTTDVDKQGLFWRINGAFIGHTGGDPGTNAVIQYNQITGAGFVVLMNGEDSEMGKDEMDEQLQPILNMIYRSGLMN